MLVSIKHKTHPIYGGVKESAVFKCSVWRYEFLFWVDCWLCFGRRSGLLLSQRKVTTFKQARCLNHHIHNQVPTRTHVIKNVWSNFHFGDAFCSSSNFVVCFIALVTVQCYDTRIGPSKGLNFELGPGIHDIRQ